MARQPNAGWTLRRDERTATLYVRFRHEKKRYNLSCGTSDAKAAGKVAAKLYTDVVTGKARKTSRAVQRGKAHDVQDLAAKWLDTDVTLRDSTKAEYGRTVLAQWPTHFPTTSKLNDDDIAAYAKVRMRQVLRPTVAKELATLKTFSRWCVDEGYLSEVPTIKVPKGTGKRAASRGLTELSQDEVEAIIAAMPERSAGHKLPVRAYFRTLYESGLRTEAVFGLRYPDDYHPGRPTLRITDANDKAKFGRELPITDACRAALDSVCPSVPGVIFPHGYFRKSMREAGRKAGLAEHRLAHLSYHDFRHARATHLLEATGSLPGVGFLLGHRLATTTNKYAKPNQRAASAVLAAIGSPVGRQPATVNESSSKEG